jgi:hypothetical protein
MNTQDVSAYLNGPFNSVEGWCIPHLWQSIQPLASAISAEIGGVPVAEIGVHHGKFFIGLVKTMGSPKDNHAIDVYDLQQFNLDGSGRGDREAFERNLEKSGVDGAAVEIVRADSTAMRERDIRALEEKVDGFSLFSIDGGHTVEHTINDMELAFRLTSSAGIIFVDDYYNANWPGVQEGVARFYQTHMPRFVPLLFTCNKLFLCHMSRHGAYLKLVEGFLRETFRTTRVKAVERFGYKGLTVIPDISSKDYLHQ